MDQSSQNSKQFFPYLNFISVIAAISVLCIHTNGCFWTFSSTEIYWKTANVLETLFYFSVPLFFMITGITLLDFYDRYNLKQFFTKRFHKTVIPFIAWSLIGLVWKVLCHKIDISEINIKLIYQGITSTSIVTIYWFFTSLFTVYLCMPVFAAINKNQRFQVFSYLVIAGFILNILIPFIKTQTGSDLNTPYKIPMVSSALFWVPLGWLLHNIKFSRLHKVIIHLFATIGFFIHLIGTYIISMNAGEVLKTYKGYENLPSVLYSIGVFILLKDIGTYIMAKPKANRFITWLNTFSLPIYLMQFIFLDLGKRFFNSFSIIYRLGAPLVIIPIIIIITILLRKIPIINRIVPK